MNSMHYIQIWLAIALWLFGGVNGEGYEYIGCYRDTGDRALRYGPHQYGYTADTCSAACDNLGYTYFALQNGGWCCCDNDLAHATKYGISTGCPSSKLGGGWANDLFENIVTTTTTETPRDCSILDIDGFLTECSLEFPETIENITGSIDELETNVYAKLTILEERVKAIEDEAGDVSSEITALENGLTAVNTRIDEFAVESAKAPPSMGFINNEPTGVDGDSWIKSRGLNVEDLLIISLLLINLIGMIYGHYRIGSKDRRSFHGKKYAVQFDEETDTEPINK